MAKSPVGPRATTAKTTTTTKTTAGRTAPRARQVVPPRRSPLPIILGLAAALVLLGIVALVLRNPSSTPATGTAAGERKVEPYASDSTQGRNHISNVAAGSYNSNPPAGGDHYGQWATWGVQTIAPPDSMLVHNLEHGGVIFWYDPAKVDAAVVQKLTTLTRNLQDTNIRVILTPRAKGIDGNKPIAATSWGYLMTEDQYNEGNLRAFFNEHINKGPECVNGQCPE
ncbi:MAG: DUF3105 domain-containing protein [Herpetosiphonaceae bacterium]|nr:DUF3105 domain-containing protein [Herpetosiphonaceae bacterium]